MSKTLTQSEARTLADAIKSNLLDLEKNLKYFHAVQGWIPLGYDSFTVWWDNELGDLPISNGLRNWAIYAMIDENIEGGRLRQGMTAVIAHATGLAPSTIGGIKSRSRPKVRWTSRKDSDPAAINFVVPTLWHRHLISLSVQKDRSMAEILRPVVKDGIMRHYGIDLDKPISNE